MPNEDYIRETLGLPKSKNKKKKTNSKELPKEYVAVKKLIKLIKPKTYEEVMAQEEQLEKEQIQKAEMERAKIHIKELKNQEKQRKYEAKLARRKKIRNFFHI
jgi:hypothetical protein